VDLLDLVTLPTRPFRHNCRIAKDLGPITKVGEEVPARDVGSTPDAVAEVWDAAQALYRTGLYPALQLCIRREGGVVLDRAIGHLRGNAPDDPEDGPKTPIELDSPFCLYSAAKAVTAMVVHKLDEERVLHLDDRVCDYIPEFGQGARRFITLRHVLGHRAGLPTIPKGSLNLDLLEDPQQIIDLLCESPRQSRPGRRFAYHAVTGGFILGEVVRRATGQDIRTVLDKQVIQPLGFRWMNYGVAPEDVHLVADDAITGLPVHKAAGSLAERILGTTLDGAIEMALDPRFRTGIIPAANIMANAWELCAWYQCLADEGEFQGVRVYEPRTVRHAIDEQAYFEFDMTLLVPLRHGLGFMLGSEWLSPWGRHSPRAFGHVGLSNIFGWADPGRRIAVALTTSGKPTASPELTRLVQLIACIGRAFPPID
jgi:CubicO group peptidase (beta-lactamase class C family)